MFPNVLGWRFEWVHSARNLVVGGDGVRREIEVDSEQQGVLS